MEKGSSTGFLNLNIAECANVYPIVIKNADAHFHCSKILAEEKEYPNAIAHLILGTEELIKGLFLFLESKEFNLRSVDGYVKLFRNHKARHSIIKEFYSVTMFLKELIMLKKKKKQENTILYYIQTVTTLIGGVVSGVANYEWWNKADGFKQDCFYVDYKSGVKDPGVISLKEYEEANNLVSAFRNDVRIIIAVLARANEKELASFRNNFNDANFKKLLASTIERSSKK